VELATPTSTEAWANFLGGAGADRLLVRAGVPAKTLPHYLQTVVPILKLSTRWFCDVAAGLLYGMARAETAVEAQGWLAGLRQPASALGGYVIALAAPAELRSELDSWGYQPASIDLMRGLKARWDPAGILNRGMFIVD
jgi:glycolate oxidase FAD binding subunit